MKSGFSRYGIRSLLVASLVFLSVALGVALAFPREPGGIETQAGAGDFHLNRMIRGATLDYVTLEDALAKLADLAHASIAIDSREVADYAGAAPDRKIVVHLQPCTLRTAIRTVIDASANNGDLDYYEGDDGVIRVVPKGLRYRAWETRVYDIRDLVERGGQFLQKHGGANADGVRYGSFKLTGSAYQQVVQKIMGLIQESVGRDTWDGNTGTAIRELAGFLIITNSSNVQLEVQVFLQQLRDNERTVGPESMSAPH